MIQFIRGKVGSWFVKILLVLLIVAFGAWGIGDMLSEDVQDPVVATVGETEITQSSLTRQFQAEVAQLSQRTNGAYTTTQAVEDRLYVGTLDTMVDSTAVAQYVNGLGLSLSDELIAAQIRNRPEFQNPPGRFDRQTFLSVIGSLGYSEAAFIQQMRVDMARSILALALNPGQTPPRVMTDLVARQRLETRSADVFTFPANPAAAPAPEESDLRRYYEAHPDQFLSQERRSFTYLFLGAATFRDEVTVSDDEVRAYYDDNVDQFTTEERRSFNLVVLDDEETARAVVEAARGGLDLADALAAVDGADADIQQFESAARGALPSVMADPIFAAEEGAVSDPFLGLGWQVAEITGIEPAVTAPFEDVADEIRTQLEIEPALDIVFEVANEVEDELASDASLEDAAASAGLEVRTIGPVSRDGQLAGGGTLDIPNAGEVLAQVFDLEAGESSLFQEIAVENSIPGDVAYYAVRVEEIEEPAPLPFETVRPAVALAWADDWAMNDARERAEAAIARIGANWVPSAIAAGYGGDVTSHEGLGRGDGGVTLPPAIQYAVFTTPEGDSTVLEGTGEVHVVVVTGVEAGGIDGDPAAVAGIEQDLVGDTANSVLFLTRSALRDMLSVSIDEDRLDSLFLGG